jgi:molybdopterin-guanine dinucleotide biosynthesis protein A
VADRGRLTGVLLVGGASTRFGSPKALAELGRETLAARAWRVLGEACDAASLRQLAAGCREAAVPPSGPLPGAYRRSALPELERRLAAGELRLRDAVAALDAAVVELDPRRLVNVNELADLERLAQRSR